MHIRTSVRVEHEGTFLNVPPAFLVQSLMHVHVYMSKLMNELV